MSLLNRAHTSTELKSLSLTLFLLGILPRPSARAEGTLDYNFQDYSETAGRVGVHTQGLLATQDLADALKLSASYVNDAIAGATPTGAPAPAGSSQVPLSQVHDHRKAWETDLSGQFQRVNVTAGYAASREHDYISKGWSLNTLTDFNQKNTTLLLGAAGHSDQVETFYDPQQLYVPHRSLSGILGVTQLLDPRTSVTFNVTWSRETGYLSDQYKVVEKDFKLLTGAIVPQLFSENRPDTHDSGVAFASVNHAFPALHAAIEGSYRFYADTYGVAANTGEVKWLQKIGPSVILAPDFRLHEQNAAKFYFYNLNQTGITPTAVPNPQGPAYSADYRLSSLSAITYGVNLSVKVSDLLKVTLDYSRYNMRGRDGVTPQSAYPDANIYSAGARISW